MNRTHPRETKGAGGSPRRGFGAIRLASDYGRLAALDPHRTQPGSWGPLALPDSGNPAQRRSASSGSKVSLAQRLVDLRREGLAFLTRLQTEKHKPSFPR